MTTALLVVDMLNDFVDGVLGNPAAKQIVAPIAELVARARAHDDWLVVYANDAHLPGDVELKVFAPHAMAGTPGARVIDELEPTAGDVVVSKRTYSPFSDPGLDAALVGHGVRRLVLVGQHTDCCVRHTAYDAFQRGYDLVVCPEATAVFEPGSPEPLAVRQERALEYLRTYYGASIEPASALP
jgi:nicotinamidase-related amidase